MHSDSVFKIGDSHAVCQDYAVSGDYLGGVCSFGVISDGCSGSPDTDIGARILAKTLSRDINAFLNFNNFRIDQKLGESDQIRCQLGLSYQCLDATFLGITCEQDTNFDSIIMRSFVSGDGYVARKFGDFLEVWEYISGNEHPLYLSYRLNEQRLAGVRKAINNESTVVHHWMRVDEHGILSHMNSDIVPSNLKASEVDNGGMKEFIKVQKRVISLPCDTGEADGVWAVFSDGVGSFSDHKNRAVSATDVICQLMNFKGTKGEFVKRRMNGFLKLARKNGWTYHDDISMAAIKL